MDIKQEILKKARADRGEAFWNENFRGCFWEYCKHQDVGTWDFMRLVNEVSQEDRLSFEDLQDEYEVSINKIEAFNKTFREAKQRVEEEIMRELQNEHQKEIFSYETN